jgi:hypothetical protein
MYIPYLKELDEWSKKWLMTFNSDKTEIMLFSNTDIPEFNFTGTPAETLQSEEDDLHIIYNTMRSTRICHVDK